MPDDLNPQTPVVAQRPEGFDALPFEVQRQQWNDAAASTPLPPHSFVEPFRANGIGCEWVRVGKSTSDKVLLMLHGGGFTSGSCITHRDLAARLSMVTGALVLLVDYRLAPEFPFPAALEDGQQVYEWLLGRGMPSKNIVLLGDSAGGNLILSLLLMLRDQGRALPGAAVFLSPWLDLTMQGESIQTRAAVDPAVTYESLVSASAHYIGAASTSNPYLSPLDADLSGLPPLLVHVGDHEILLSDAIRLYERASGAGVSVRLQIWDEMWHVFHSWAATLPIAQTALNAIAEFIQDLDQPPLKESSHKLPEELQRKD